MILNTKRIHNSFWTNFPGRAKQMPFRFAVVRNKEISQLIKQAVSEIHDEGDVVRFDYFNR